VVVRRRRPLACITTSSSSNGRGADTSFIDVVVSTARQCPLSDATARAWAGEEEEYARGCTVEEHLEGAVGEGVRVE
jgi:hypothetical protein